MPDRSRFTDFTPEKRERFIKELRKMPNVSRAARLAKTSRRTAYNHRQTDAEFAAQWDDALEEGIEKLEENAWKRAESTSDTLMIFLLKAHKPDKYRDNRHYIDVTTGGQPLAPPTPEQAAAVLATYERFKREFDTDDNADS